jgi:CheY-like chemotaxis protein
MIDSNEFKKRTADIKIMHIDSSSKLLENSTQLLHKMFDKVFFTSKGLNALAIFQIEHPQIVLSEIELQDTSGIELIRQIKKISPSTHIVVITSHDTKENLIELIPLHVNKLLTKPIQAPALVKTLIEIIEEIEKEREKEKALSSQPVKILQMQAQKPCFEEITTIAKETKLDDSTILIEQLLEIKKLKKVVHLHNYYKGLSITNNAYIVDVGSTHITLRTNNVQQKAIQYASKSVLVSDLLPKPISCSNILKIEFNSEQVMFRDFVPLDSSPITRKSVRVDVNEVNSVLININGHIFAGEASIEDISIDAVKLRLDSMPAGIHKNLFPILLELTIETQLTAIQLKCEAKYLREDEKDSSYSVLTTSQNYNWH